MVEVINLPNPPVRKKNESDNPADGFFLAVLAVVLIGFGTTTYTFSRRDLYFDAAEQINFVLKTLESAAQIRPMGVGWEPPFLFVSVGVRSQAQSSRVGVYSPHGKRIVSTAHFQDLEGADDFPRVVDSQENQLTYFEDSGGRSWMFMKHQIAPKPNTARETSLQKMDGLIVAVAVSARADQQHAFSASRDAFRGFHDRLVGVPGDRPTNLPAGSATSYAYVRAGRPDERAEDERETGRSRGG